MLCDGVPDDEATHQGNEEGGELNIPDACYRYPDLLPSGFCGCEYESPVFTMRGTSYSPSIPGAGGLAILTLIQGVFLNLVEAGDFMVKG